MKHISKSLMGLMSAAVAVFLLISAPLTVFAANTQALTTSLINKAQANDSVRVIVKLDVAFSTESSIQSPDMVDSQRSRITSSQNAVLQQINSDGVTAIKQFETIPFLALEVSETALLELLSNPTILSIEEDIAVPPSLLQSVPFINGDDVEALGYDGSGWSVAVLDTGVRKTHIDLDNGKVVSEACYGTTSAGNNSTTMCPNGQEFQVGSGAGVNCSTSIASACSHGTHVAGISSGTYGGVANDSNVIAIQVFSRFDNAASCNGVAPCVLSYTSDQILGLERVFALRSTFNIASANMSLGGGQYSSFCDSDSRKAIIDNLRGAGIATVISSGNDGYNGQVGAPGCISTAITVGATLDSSDSISSYSNHASMVDILAPGSSITSSIATSTTARASWNGTSMAAPHVAGAYALFKDVKPNATVTEIENALESTGINITRSGVTKPRMDLLAAATALGAAPQQPDLIVQSPGVSDTTLTPGQAFTTSATTRNQGAGPSNSTTLRFYLSTNSTISASDTQLSTDTVSALAANATEYDSDSNSAPASEGTYWVGACVDAVSNESNTANNCSAGVQVVVASATTPDLIVQSPGVSSSSLTPGQAFATSATTRNQGTGPSNSTTLRFYLSTNSTISASDTQLSTDTVSTLAANATEYNSDSNSAPASEGTYWVGACVDSVSNESNTANNCSVGVQIVVVALTPDAFEPDNDHTAAKPILKSETQLHNFHVVGDTDWITFTLTKKVFNLTIETSDAGFSGDTRLYLHNGSLTQIAFDDDGGAGIFSLISLSELEAGTYFILVDEFGNDATIGGYNLQLNFSEEDPADSGILDFLPAIISAANAPLPGRSCGAQLIYDCSKQCVNAATVEAWIGDGFCDDGTFGIVLTCPAFNNDDGDCD